jgi:hypothetical protein
VQDWLFTPCYDDPLSFALRHIALPLIFGSAVAWLAWRLTTNSRRTLRIIDLVSHFLAIIGLLWSLTAVGNYQKKFLAGYEQMRINDKSLDLQFEAIAQLTEICEKEPPSTAKRRDCNKFIGYLTKLRDGAGAHDKVPFPPIRPEDYASSEVRSLATTLSKEFEGYNATLQGPHWSGLTADDFNEYWLLTYVVQFLSFAFGLGLMRRILDLYTDWKLR